MMDINNNNVHFITSNKVRTSSVRKCFVTEVELKRREGGTHRGIPLEMVLCSSFQISQYSLLSSKSSTSPSSTRRIFTFLNDLRSCATRSGQSHCVLSDDRLHILCSRVRCSTSENLWSSSLKICLWKIPARRARCMGPVYEGHIPRPHRDTPPHQRFRKRT